MKDEREIHDMLYLYFLQLMRYCQMMKNAKTMIFLEMNKVAQGVRMLLMLIMVATMNMIKKENMVVPKDGAKVVHMVGGKVIRMDGAISVIHQMMMMDTGLNRVSMDMEVGMALMMKGIVSVFHLEVTFKDRKGRLLALVEAKAPLKIFSTAFSVQHKEGNLNSSDLQALPLTILGKKKKLVIEKDMNLLT